MNAKKIKPKSAPKKRAKSQQPSVAGQASAHQASAHQASKPPAEMDEALDEPPIAKYAPLMISLEGTTLTKADKRRLAHPLVGGVILFERNYVDRMPLVLLVIDIRKACKGKPIIIAVDHEGGRVQRFRRKFVRLPSPAEYGRLYEESKKRARLAAALGGFVMASQLARDGVTCSFAPVLDVCGGCEVVGARAFHEKPKVVANIADAFMDGMWAAGFGPVGKHFPGHGHAVGDSHSGFSRDDRPLGTLVKTDITAFYHVLESLEGVMTSHVLYPCVDSYQIATYSDWWLQDVLRNKLGFTGAVFSDDLVMHGASSYSEPHERVLRALQAGCDMVLMCNDTDFIDSALADFNKGVVAGIQSHCAERTQRLEPFWKNYQPKPLRYAGKTWDLKSATKSLLDFNLSAK